MAKKQTIAINQADPGDEHVEQVVTVKETPKPRLKPKNIINGWEIKDRQYIIKGGKTPLSHAIRTRAIFWYDEELGYEREMKYCQNQKSVFVDEMKGPERLSHVIFRNGALMVPRQQAALQKLLSLYHPDRDRIFEEVKPQENAEHDVDVLELQVDALVAARGLDIEMMEAVMRTNLGSKVSKMTSKELKRDTLLFAKSSPKLFLDLVSDDNVHLRNVGLKATEEGILGLSEDQRTFTWTSNGRKLMNVPFDEHPYSALAAWFKTDEGMEIFSSIEKRLK